MDPLKKDREMQALLSYSHEFNLKKKKSKVERQLVEQEPRFVIYARKSTEDNKRQVQSIADQIKHCQKFAETNNLKVVDIRTEEKSAKIAGKRTVFNEILENVREGNAYDSILSWHPDRLARNMKESGEILDLLDNDILIDLKFASVSFTNDAAGKMMLSILFAMAKEFSDKLSIDTKRGIKTKINQGKYGGKYKRGYLVNKEEHFRPDQNTFHIYKDVWKRALKGESIQTISNFYPDENIPSGYLKDPFAAGIHCVGDQVVNLLDVDSQFEPLTTPEEFLTVQRMSQNRGGWQVTDDFLPFRQLVKCSYCKNFMTPGRSKSQHGKRYLYITCGNSRCKASLKASRRPANSLRSRLLVDYVITFLESNLEVSEKLYQDVIKNLRKTEFSFIRELMNKLKTIRSNRSKLKNKERMYEDKILKSDNSENISSRLTEINGEIRLIDKEISDLEQSVAELETKMALELPDYNVFVNFFKNIVTALQTTQDPHLMDKLVKLVFLNFSVGDKKVLSHKLNEPFNSYWGLKNQSGVEDGI